MNFSQPSVPAEFHTNVGVPAAPTSDRGPTTRLCGLVYAPAKSAPDCVAQFSTTPRGRTLLCLAVPGHAETADINPIAAATKATLAIADARRDVMRRSVTRAAASA
jgi:hypothetical protein